MLFLNDKEIEDLINEEKNLVSNGYNDMTPAKPLRGHKQQEIICKRPDGSQFRIFVRQNSIDLLSFSVILAFSPSKSNFTFRLRRYNGRHQHTNRIERNTFYDFHIHKATEKYQKEGLKEDGYAEVSNEYTEIRGAIDKFVKDCNIKFGNKDQLPLFEGGEK